MIYVVALLLATLFLPVNILAAEFVPIEQLEADLDIQKSCVRISVNDKLNQGSGNVYAISKGKIFILTCGHNLSGTNLTVEFFTTGKPSHGCPGNIEKRIYNKHVLGQDLAIISTKVKDLGDYHLPKPVLIE